MQIILNLIFFFLLICGNNIQIQQYKLLQKKFFLKILSTINEWKGVKKDNNNTRQFLSAPLFDFSSPWKCKNFQLRNFHNAYTRIRTRVYIFARMLIFLYFHFQEKIGIPLNLEMAMIMFRL
jgi:hypothetical protein